MLIITIYNKYKYHRQYLISLYIYTTKKNKAWIFFGAIFVLVRLSAHARAIPRSLRRSAFTRAKKILPHRSHKSRLQSLSPPREIPLHHAVVPLAVRIDHRIAARGRPGPGAADDVAEAEKVAGDR